MFLPDTRWSPIRHSPFHRNFVESLLTYCSLHDLSIAQLAKITGVARTTIYQWIHRDHFPLPDNYNKLAELFGWPRFQKGEIKHDESENS